MLKLRLIAGFGLLAAAAAALGVRPVMDRYENWRNEQHAEFLADRAERAPSSGRATVRKIRDLPGESLSTLMRLAASPRQTVADAAQEAINAKLTVWAFHREQFGADGSFGRELASLADLLAANVDQFSQRPSNVQWARRTATGILLEANHVDREWFQTIVARCEYVFNTLPADAGVGDSLTNRTANARSWNGAVRQPPTNPGDPNAAQQTGGAPSTLIARIARPQAETTSARSRSSSNQSPGRAALRPDLSWKPRTPQPQTTTSRAVPPQLRIVATPHSAVTPTPLEAPTTQAAGPLPIPSTADPHQLPLQPPTMDPTIDSSASSGADGFLAVPSPAVMRHTSRVVSQLSNQELLERLQAPTTRQFLAAAIARELKRRGVGQGRYINRSTALPEASPDRTSLLDQGAAQGRFAVARDEYHSLTRNELRSLTRDADPKVRRRALALLATTGDPQLPQIARQRAVYDEDAGVAEVARQILEDDRRR